MIKHEKPFLPGKIILLYALVHFITHNKLHVVLKDYITSIIMTKYNDVAWCHHKSTKRSEIRQHNMHTVYKTTILLYGVAIKRPMAINNQYKTWAGDKKP